MESESKSPFWLNWKGFATLLILALIIHATAGLMLYQKLYLKNPNDAGVFGDMFGVLTALFSSLSFAGVIYTVILQRYELNETRKELALQRTEFKSQSETAKLQRFENTFFNLINVYHQKKESCSLSSSIHGAEAISHNLTSISSTFSSTIYDDKRLLELKEKYKGLAVFPSFISHIINTFTFINKSDLTEDQKKFYGKVFHTLFTVPEVAVLFYDINFGKGIDKNTKAFIDALDFINFDKNDFQKFLPNESFKHVLHPKSL